MYEPSRMLKSASLIAAAVAPMVFAAAPEASAATTIISNTVRIWSGDTPGANAGSASQQGLPTATGAFGGPLPLVAGTTTYVAPINYNDASLNTIAGFFASNSPASPTPSTCNSACANYRPKLGKLRARNSYRIYVYGSDRGNLCGDPR